MTHQSLHFFQPLPPSFKTQMTTTELAKAPSQHVQKYGPKEVIYIGNTPVPARDVLQAWGGAMITGLAKKPKIAFGNPSPLGLCAFATTTFLLSMINARARHVSHDSIVMGLAFFYGGMAQFVAGICEFVVNNTFGGTALTSYGAFWLSFGAIQCDAFGIRAGYATSGELFDALGLYLIVWFMFTFVMCAVTCRSTWGFFSLFFFLDITFLLLAIAHFDHNGTTINVAINKAGGWFGMLTALIAYYNAYAGLADSTNSFVQFEGAPMPWSVVPEVETAQDEETTGKHSAIDIAS